MCYNTLGSTVLVCVIEICVSVVCEHILTSSEEKYLLRKNEESLKR